MSAEAKNTFFRQAKILDKLIVYLNSLPIDEHRNAVTIAEELEKGHCHGFSVLMLIAEQLSEQERESESTRDDLETINDYLNQVLLWDGITPLNINQKRIFDRILNYIIFMQSPRKIFPKSLQFQSPELTSIISKKGEISTLKKSKSTSFIAESARDHDFKKLLKLLEKDHFAIVGLDPCTVKTPLQFIKKHTGHAIFIRKNKNSSFSVRDSNGMLLIPHQLTSQQLFKAIWKTGIHKDGTDAFFIQAQTFNLAKQDKEIKHDRKEIKSAVEIQPLLEEKSSNLPNDKKEIAALLSQKLKSKDNSLETDKQGRNLIHLSAISGDFDLCKKSISSVMKEIKKTYKKPHIQNALLLKFLTQRDCYGFTPLIYATEEESYRYIKKLCDTIFLSLKNKLTATILLYEPENNDFLTAKIQRLEKSGKHKQWVNAIGAGGFTPLMQAIAQPNKKIALDLIKLTNGMNVRNEYGQTALYLAARSGDTDIVNALIAAGADINQADNDGNTPLHIAASQANSACVIALLKAGAKHDSTNTDGQTALGLVSGKNPIHYQKIVAILALLTEEDTALDEVKSSPKEREIPEILPEFYNQKATIIAYYAAQYCEKERLLEALRDGANPLLQDTEKNNLLHCMAFIKDKIFLQKMIKIIFSACKEISSDPFKEFLGYLTQRNTEGITPLMLLKKYGDPDSINYLKNLIDGLYQPPVVFSIIENRDTVKLKQILDQPPYVAYFKEPLEKDEKLSPEIHETLLIDEQDLNGFTPLMQAILQKINGMAKALILCKCNLALKNKFGETAFYIAARENNIKLMDVLIVAKADINQADLEGNTPLHIAAKKGNIKILTYLLKAGAKTDLTNNAGETPFELVEKLRKPVYKRVMKMLVEKANHCVNSKGETPLHIAIQKNDLGLIEIFKTSVTKEYQNYLASKEKKDEKTETITHTISLSQNASLATPDKDGNTPLHRAILNNKPEIVTLLLSMLNPKTCLTALTTPNADGKNVLHLAVKLNNSAIFPHLLKVIQINIFDENTRGLILNTEYKGETALTLAMSPPSVYQAPNLVIASHLVAAGAKIKQSDIHLAKQYVQDSEGDPTEKAKAQQYFDKLTAAFRQQQSVVTKSSAPEHSNFTNIWCRFLPQPKDHKPENIPGVDQSQIIVDDRSF